MIWSKMFNILRRLLFLVSSCALLVHFVFVWLPFLYFRFLLRCYWGGQEGESCQARRLWPSFDADILTHSLIETSFVYVPLFLLITLVSLASLNSGQRKNWAWITVVCLWVISIPGVFWTQWLHTFLD